VTSGQALEEIVDQVCALLLQRIGLRTDRTLRGRVRRAVRDEALERSKDPIAYFDMLAMGGDVVQSLLNRVTVQETAFFRHPEHFDVLARDILPTLPRPVTIWSAGCANGQEAFSLAMLLEEQGIDGGVIATDLSTAAVQRTAAARYSTRELSGLSPERVSRHMRRTGAEWEVTRPVRERVRPLQHNLLDPLPPMIRSCQIVFCQNVLIYLSPAHARGLLDRVADGFPVTTPVFLGAAETMWQLSDRFKAVAIRSTFVYRSAPDRIPASTTDPASVTGAPRPAADRPVLRRPEAVPGNELADRRRRRPGPDAERARAEPESPSAAELLAKTGQDAVAAGHYHAAVVAFRKCAYLLPSDPVTQLHLGLALEAAGDGLSAHRAFASARRALLTASRAPGHDGVEGYASGELIRLIDTKLRVQPQ